MPTDTAHRQSLLAPRFLFRFEVPLHHSQQRWSDERGVALDPQHQLLNLAALDGEATWADIRAAWSQQGLLIAATVADKHQPAWCRDTRLEDSDGLQVWIDTRPAGNVHRATKFCHRYVFLPGGGGRNFEQPVADQLLIGRARENARPVRPRELKVHAGRVGKGYSLSAFIPTVALPGFDPAEQMRLGFNYAVYDREYGVQTFSTGSGFPFEEDPSLWAILQMVS